MTSPRAPGQPPAICVQLRPDLRVMAPCAHGALGNSVVRKTVKDTGSGTLKSPGGDLIKGGSFLNLCGQMPSSPRHSTSREGESRPLQVATFPWQQAFPYVKPRSPAWLCPSPVFVYPNSTHAPELSLLTAPHASQLRALHLLNTHSVSLPPPVPAPWGLDSSLPLLYPESMLGVLMGFTHCGPPPTAQGSWLVRGTV